MLNFLAQHFYTIVYSWIALALIIFPIALNVTAPYGRHSLKSFLMMPSKWGWILMELPSPIIFSFFILLNFQTLSAPVFIFFILFNLHYIHRSLVWPFMTRSEGKQMPVYIALSAILFNVMNGSINGYYLGFLGEYSSHWFSDPRFIFGFLLFVMGAYINISHDYKLIGLRKNSNDSGYKIPKGGLFRYISAPNLFGEIVEWTGWALMTWSIPTLSFAIWTWANLLPRALDHHHWYKNHFADYPKKRKAVIPGIL